MGGKDEDITLQAWRSKQKVPERIANAPELLPWLTSEYEAFFELTTCRMDGVIPWTAIYQYAQAHGLSADVEELERFTYLIRAMDRVYVESRSKGTKTPTPTGKKGK